jgi:hypothetical protein
LRLSHISQEDASCSVQVIASTMHRPENRPFKNRHRSNAVTRNECLSNHGCERFPVDPSADPATILVGRWVYFLARASRSCLYRKWAGYNRVFPVRAYHLSLEAWYRTKETSSFVGTDPATGEESPLQCGREPSALHIRHVAREVDVPRGRGCCASSVWRFTVNVSLRVNPWNIVLKGSEGMEIGPKRRKVVVGTT